MNYRAIGTASALSVGLLFVALLTPAKADFEYAWCGYQSMFQGYQQSCTFSTLEQCQAFVAGNGYCDTNPRGPLARRGTSVAPDFAAPVRRR